MGMVKNDTKKTLFLPRSNGGLIMIAPGRRTTAEYDYDLTVVDSVADAKEVEAPHIVQRAIEETDQSVLVERLMPIS